MLCKEDGLYPDFAKVSDELLEDIEILKLDVFSFGQDQNELLDRLLRLDPRAPGLARTFLSQLQLNLKKVTSRCELLVRKTALLHKLVLVPNLDAPAPE